MIYTTARLTKLALPELHMSKMYTNAQMSKQSKMDKFLFILYLQLNDTCRKIKKH